jgi:DNA mismatch endonuclease (patch repair protein)
VSDDLPNGGGKELRAPRAKVPEALNPGRRRNMQANKRRDTGPERAIRSALHALGYRFRVDYPIDLGTVRVRPDIVFPRKRISIFVDGCFWHDCPNHGRLPSINQEYWSPKLGRTVERDLENTTALEKAGWTVIRLWEHEQTIDAISGIMAAIQIVDERLASMP